MANRFVRKTGNDSNDGLSAATAWATIGKAVGAAGMADGDVCYIGAGVYRETTINFGLTDPTIETKLVGDVNGVMTGDAGEVRVTNRTTNDKTAGAGAVLHLQGRSNITLENLIFESGTDSTLISGLAGLNQTLKKLVIINSNPTGFNGRCCDITTTGGVNHNMLFDQCVFFRAGTNAAICRLQTFFHTADYDAGIVFKRCLTIGGPFFESLSGGTGTGKAGNIKVLYHTHIGGSVISVSTNLAQALPMIFRHGIFIGAGTGFAAAVGGNTSVNEDYNRICFPTARSNVTAGANSQATNAHAVLWELGQSYLNNLLSPSPFFMPTAGSPLLGFGSDGTNTMDEDFLGKPRPSGAENTWTNVLRGIGAMERHNTAVQETGANADGGTGSAIKLIGPSNQSFSIPVDNTATTITVKTKWDSNHGNTNKPQMILLAESSLGITQQTITATGTAGSSYETLTTASFTPTKKGVITILLISRAAAGNGIAYFDTVGVS